MEGTIAERMGLFLTMEVMATVRTPLAIGTVPQQQQQGFVRWKGSRNGPSIDTMTMS